jgi:hypothetical protein
MPLPLIRNGNVYIESCSFSKNHGATPTQLKAQYEALSNVALSTAFGIGIGGSVWWGSVIDSHVRKSGSVGRVTELTCNDDRELLQSQMVFCQLNQIDRKTGKIYTILDDAFVKALVELNYITQGVANNEYGKWGFLRQFEPWDIIYPQTVIRVLCHLAGFAPPIFSAKTREILGSTAAVLANQDIQGTIIATNNFFGIDWQMGEKCGSALSHICDLLGLQFTLTELALTPNKPQPRLSFFQIGEASYQMVPWSPPPPGPPQVPDPQSTGAEESTQGTALQTQVDTGVWIMGERDVWELNQLDLVPAWNQAWNRWVLNSEQWIVENILMPAGLDQFATTIGELRDAGSVTVTVKYIYMNGSTKTEGTYPLVLATLYDDGFTEAGVFADLSIHDYVERVVFKVYRIAIMDQFLSEDEFYGVDADGNRVPVRFKPIHTPLISDPSVPYHVFGTRVFKASKRHKLPISAPKMRMEKGHRLSDETGHVVFDTRQCKVSDAVLAYQLTHEGCNPPMDQAAPNVPTSISADAPAIDVCFYGPVYRKPFGDADNPHSFTEDGVLILPRIGTKKISGLRHGKVIVNASMTNPKDASTTPWGLQNMTVEQYMAQQSDYVLDPDLELDADTQAFLVANALINRPHIVRSGEERFAGICGHEPDGEIRRVSVSIDGTRGITETVSYANDYPSLFHEPDIELLRRMSVDSALRQADRLKRSEFNAECKQQNVSEAEDALKDDVTSQKRVIVNNHLEIGLVEPS